MHYREISSQITDSRNQIRNTLKAAGVGDLGQVMTSGPAGGGIGSLLAGQNTSASRAFDHYKSWVYVCTAYIARRVAGQPILAGEPAKEPKAQRGGQTRIKNAFMPWPVKHHISMNDVDVIAEHPALDALARPNSLQDSYSFRYLSTANLLLTGESYWIASESTDEDGEKRLELWAVPTHWIIASHKKGPYSSFRLKTPGMVGQGIALDPEQVMRTYLPDPECLTSVKSPLHAIHQAARIDDSILYSQDQMFQRGINPNLMITIAQRRGPDGKPTGSRPTLSDWQHSQLVQSIREVWGRTLNYGDPAIIDGVIDKVEKLQAMPSEMDWQDSSTFNKSRIFQAFGLNPIVVGEIMGANRAQAVEAEKSACTNAVNPIINCFSATIMERVAPLYDTEDLMLWIQPCDPIDSELQDKRWLEGHKQGLITDSEIRAEIYNLPPKAEQPKNQMLTTHTGWAATQAVVVQYQSGQIDRVSAIQQLMLFLEIDEKMADLLVGEEPEINQAPAGEVIGTIDEGSDNEDAELEGDGDDDENIGGRPVQGDGDGDGVLNESAAQITDFKSAMIDTLEAFEAETLKRVKLCLGDRKPQKLEQS